MLIYVKSEDLGTYVIVMYYNNIQLFHWKFTFSVYYTLRSNSLGLL